MSAVATAAPDTGKRVIADRVAAIVNDELILVSELDIRMLPLRTEAAKISDKTERDRRLVQLARQALDEMINDELIVQAAHAAKLTVDQAELDATIKYLKQENGFDDKELEAAMKQHGITMTTLRNNLLRQRAINQFVAPKVNVTDEEVKAQYDQLLRRSASVTAVRVSQLVFALPDRATEKQVAEVKQKAQRALERIKAGEAFADVAGDLGDGVTGTENVWLDPGNVLPELEAIVFGMDKGDLRGPVAGPGGIYVVHANEVKRTPLKSFADMKDSLTADLRRKSLVKHTQTWIEELRKKAYIELKLDS